MQSSEQSSVASEWPASEATRQPDDEGKQSRASAQYGHVQSSEQSSVSKEAIGPTGATVDMLSTVDMKLLSTVEPLHRAFMNRFMNMTPKTHMP